MYQYFPAIDPVETGKNIVRLRKERGLSVKDIQAWFNFEEPRAIYKWQSGQTLPSVDNLYALSVLLGVSMDNVIVGTDAGKYNEPQGNSCGSYFFAQLQVNCYFRYTSAICFSCSSVMGAGFAS